MEPWASDLLDAYALAVPDIARSLHNSVEADPATKGKYKFDDILQMVQGAMAMASEYLQDGTTEIRDTYIGSVVPGIMAQGEALETLVGQSVYSLMIQLTEFLTKVKPEHQRKVGEFWAWWCLNYQREQIRAALEAMRSMNQ